MKKIDKNELLNRANKINKYKYSYNCSNHVEFKQTPINHTNSRKQGCPICNESKSEALVAFILQSYNIDFEMQKKFKDLKHKVLLIFDFYLPDYNICIEYDGEQHYSQIDDLSDNDAFCELQFRDALKDEYCENNKIQLLRLTYKDSDDDVRSKLLNFLDIKESLITRFSIFKNKKSEN